MKAAHSFTSYSDAPSRCSVWGCFFAGPDDHEALDAPQPCFGCGLDTSFGSGRFINRVPADDTADGRPGYICEECMSDGSDD
jgi:hypothetical protein